MPLLDQVCDPKARLERRTVERVISMLLWFTGGCGWLKPWLEPLYKILFKPRAIPRLVNFTRFSEFVQALDANLVVTEHVRCCDVCLKWRLHSINNCQVSSRKSSSFVTPKSRNGQISLIFYDYENPRTSSDKNAAWAAQLLKKQCGPAQGFLCHMCLAEAPLEFAAADAWADENSAGIGAGGGRLVVQRRRHLLVGLAFNLNVPIFPLGFVLQSQSHHLWQACISAFEALAQLVLLCLRCQFGDRHGSLVLKLAQLCDNHGVMYSTFKMLSMEQLFRFPLLPPRCCFVVQPHCWMSL